MRQIYYNHPLNIDLLILNTALPLTTYPSPTAAVMVVGLCLTVKGWRASSHKANSCIHKVLFPLACTIYFRPPSNPYLLSEFTVANKAMGNRFLEKSGEGAGHKTDRLDLEKCQPNFCELYIIWRSRVKARDRSGDIDGEKESRSDLGKQSGFVVADSDAFDT